MSSVSELATYCSIASYHCKLKCEYTNMGMLPTLNCTTHFVEDAPNSWATKTSAQNGVLFSISFWYTPQNNCAMTMAEVASIIESNIGIRIGKIRARGMIIQRAQLGNYVAADILKDGEDFTIECLPLCCTVL